MVTVNLTDGYFVEIDELNHTLKQKKVIKDKVTGEDKEREVTVGYFGKLEPCVRECLRLNCLSDMNGMSISLDEFLNRAESSLNESVRKICEVVGNDSNV